MDKQKILDMMCHMAAAWAATRTTWHLCDPSAGTCLPSGVPVATALPRKC